MLTIIKRLQHVRQQISQAELSANRQPGSVQLLAVSKTKPAMDLACAYTAGQRHFAESYLQEALSKQCELSHYNITWHFIGPIQSNKTRPIAEHFSWVHSVDRLKIAQRLSAQRPDHLPPLNICLQVNISKESSKSGVSLEQLPILIKQVQELPNLNCRGLMAIPAPSSSLQQQRQPYQQMMQVIGELPNTNLDSFSFGMSGDLQAAIIEGATMVRIGTAIFGTRN